MFSLKFAHVPSHMDVDICAYSLGACLVSLCRVMYCCFFLFVFFNACSPASIVRCRDPPTLASGVTVQAYNSTAVNSDIFFQCQQPDLVPLYRSATCGSDGRWSPDPSRVECRMITPMPTETPTLTDTPTSTVPTGTPVPTGIKVNIE